MNRDWVGLAPVGAHHHGDNISGVVTLAPPEGATRLLIQALDQDVWITFDGTPPNAGTKIGFKLKAAADPLLIELAGSAVVKVLQDAATATIQYQWGA